MQCHVDERRAADGILDKATSEGGGLTTNVVVERDPAGIVMFHWHRFTGLVCAWRTAPEASLMEPLTEPRVGCARADQAIEPVKKEENNTQRAILPISPHPFVKICAAVYWHLSHFWSAKPAAACGYFLRHRIARRYCRQMTRSKLQDYNSMNLRWKSRWGSRL